MSGMIMCVRIQHPNGLDDNYVELEGKWATYWENVNDEEPTFVGAIDDLPKEVLKVLTDLGMIRKH